MPKIVTLLVLVMYFLIFLIGLINVINPEWIWRRFESWKATKEPSKEFFLMRRISGLFIMLVITGISLFPYIMSIMNP